MTQVEALRTLITGIPGVTWAKVSEVAKGARLGKPAVYRFLEGTEVSPTTIEALEWWVWRCLNAHVLLTPEETQWKS